MVYILRKLKEKFLRASHSHLLEVGFGDALPCGAQCPWYSVCPGVLMVGILPGGLIPATTLEVREQEVIWLQQIYSKSMAYGKLGAVPQICSLA